MRGKLKAGIGLLIATSTLLLFSCQKPFHDENEKYVFIAANVSLPYWQEAQAGFKDAGRALGVKVDVEGPTSYSPMDELDAFQKAVAAHPSGILISPAKPDLFNSAIDQATSAGIPVICADSDAPNSKRVMFIGTDNVKAGQESAKHLAALLNGKGNIVIMSIPGQLNLDQRNQGAMEVLKGYPKIKVLETYNDTGDPRLANDQISALLAKKTKLDGVLCLEASGGPGAAEALHRLGLNGKIFVVAMDKTPETLDWISQGVISGTIAQKPYTMAFYGLRFLDDLHHNVVHQFKDWRNAPASPLPSWVDTGTAWVDKSNVDAFKAAVPERNPLLN
jgi:ribose transport system substrate-binding protein